MSILIEGTTTFTLGNYNCISSLVRLYEAIKWKSLVPQLEFPK